MMTFDPKAFIRTTEDAGSSLYVVQQSDGKRGLCRGYYGADRERMLPTGPLSPEDMAAVMDELIAQGKLLVAPPPVP
jgi:hypothetical protein